MTDERPDIESIHEQIERRRRDEAFQARLAEIMERDKDILEILARGPEDERAEEPPRG